jgi:hypothetical protein
MERLVRLVRRRLPISIPSLPQPCLHSPRKGVAVKSKSSKVFYNSERPYFSCECIATALCNAIDADPSYKYEPRPGSGPLIFPLPMIWYTGPVLSCFFPNILVVTFQRGTDTGNFFTIVWKPTWKNTGDYFFMVQIWTRIWNLDFRIRIHDIDFWYIFLSIDCSKSYVTGIFLKKYAQRKSVLESLVATPRLT